MKKYDMSLKSIFIIFSIIGIISLVSLALSISICPFYNITGVYCPSCGMTHAFYALMHFDIKKAFYYNPMFILVPLSLLPFFIKQFIKPIKKSTMTKYFIILLIILIVTWIARLILFFPNAPVEYNKNSLFYTIYTHIVTLQ